MYGLIKTQQLRRSHTTRSVCRLLRKQTNSVFIQSTFNVLSRYLSSLFVQHNVGVMKLYDAFIGREYRLILHRVSERSLSELHRPVIRLYWIHIFSIPQFCTLIILFVLPITIFVPLPFTWFLRFLSLIKSLYVGKKIMSYGEFKYTTIYIFVPFLPPVKFVYLYRLLVI